MELLVVLGSWIVLRRHLSALENTAPAALAPKRTDPQLAQLTAYADRLYIERKWLAAEKAYINVLELDHKNFTAYVHLGIIYSTQKSMADAIECFQIAVRLHPSGSTYQNLALAFYDNRNFIKSIAMYEKAIMLEPTAQRQVGLGKAYLKLHNIPSATAAFERAVEMDPAKRTLERLAEVYDEADRKADMEAVYRRIHEIDPADLIAAKRMGTILPPATAPELEP